MKKSFRIVLALMMALVLVFSLSSCGGVIDTKYEAPKVEDETVKTEGDKEIGLDKDGNKVIVGEKENLNKYEDWTVREEDQKGDGKEESKGFLGTIYFFFGKILSGLGSITNSYMLSLFIFAIAIKLIFVFADIKQRKTIVKQAYFKPKQRAIMNKYKGRNDRPTQQKMQQEIMEAQQREGISMTGGCLPMLLQMPILLIIFEVIRNPLHYVSGFSSSTINSIRNVLCYNGGAHLNLNGVSESVMKLIQGSNPGAISELDLVPILRNNWESFQSVHGLAGLTPDSLPNFYAFGSHVDLSFTPTFKTSGWNLLYLLIPVLTFVILYFSMRLNRKMSESANEQADPSAPNMAASMKVMDFVMPAMSAYFAFLFPAILGIYFMFSNVLSMIQSVILTKIYPLPVFTEEDYKKAEKEYNKGKTVKKVKGPVDPNKPKVRSLHHIDDDDEEYPELPPMKDDEETREEKKGKIAPAPLKKEEEPKEKKNRKKQKESKDSSSEASEKSDESKDQKAESEEVKSENEEKEADSKKDPDEKQ